MASSDSKSQLTDFTVDRILSLHGGGEKPSSSPPFCSAHLSIIERCIESSLRKNNGTNNCFNNNIYSGIIQERRRVNFIEICSFNGLLTTRKVIGWYSVNRP